MFSPEVHTFEELLWAFATVRALSLAYASQTYSSSRSGAEGTGSIAKTVFPQ